MSGVQSWSRPSALCVCLLVAAGCSGGGGGGSGGFDNRATLLELRFPDPGAQNTEPNTEPPTNASLVQQVSFRFSGRPDPAEISSATIEVRDSAGVLVAGSFDVHDLEVVFTPLLPTKPVVELGPGIYDTGGTSLQPGQSYSYKLGPSTWRFIGGISADLLAQFADPNDSGDIKFFVRTTTDPTLFLTGLPPKKPELVSTDPRDGASGISPNLFSDPDGLFPEPQSYTLVFHKPVNPSTANLTGFRLIDLDDPTSDFPDGVPLSVDIELLSNELNLCVVEIAPSGILPFGHLIALEYPEDLKGLSEGDTSGADSAVACMFTTADVEPGIDVVNDRIVEVFDDTSRRADNEEVSKGFVPASWDLDGSNLLQAAAAFQGDGELGRFVPPPPLAGETTTIFLDTSEQPFPLFDGSTPDAPVSLVSGGVFSFTSIDIPAGVLIIPQGPNPLVLLATGTVRIAGEIRANAMDGINESSYDSAVTSTPGGAGGPGGGRGGVGHPIVFWPPDSQSILSMVSPVRGGRGYGAGDLGQIGGEGGETGIMDHKPVGVNYELDNRGCGELYDEHGNGGRTPGGGGGSFLTMGNGNLVPDRHNGIGNVRADGQGGYIIPPKEQPDDLFYGSPGVSPFADGSRANDYIGVTGEVQEIIGGQGGGGGGSRLESYYCGAWCLFNERTEDDKLCLGGEFPLGDPLNQTFSASVGDGKGGGGGGGGGAIAVRSLGPITLEVTGILTAKGGIGGGGEALGCGNWGGGAGGGTGGTIILESAESVLVRTGSRIDVLAGLGAKVVTNDNYYSGCSPSGDTHGIGGHGSFGLIQLQVPFGKTATVQDNGSIKPLASWVDKDNVKNPAAFTALSQAVSSWYDAGRMIAREPAGTSPSFRFRVAGADAAPGGTGQILVDALGYVVDPEDTDIVCDYLGQFNEDHTGYDDPPREDFIPTNARTYVEFQGADAMAEGSKEVDPLSLTDWSSSPVIANGHQFIRFRISIDIAAGGAQLSSDLPLPAVQAIEIRAEY